MLVPKKADASLLHNTSAPTHVTLHLHKSTVPFFVRVQQYMRCVPAQMSMCLFPKSAIALLNKTLFSLCPIQKFQTNTKVTVLLPQKSLSFFTAMCSQPSCGSNSNREGKIELRPHHAWEMLQLWFQYGTKGYDSLLQHRMQAPMLQNMPYRPNRHRQNLPLLLQEAATRRKRQTSTATRIEKGPGGVRQVGCWAAVAVSTHVCFPTQGKHKCARFCATAPEAQLSVHMRAEDRFVFHDKKVFFLGATQWKGNVYIYIYKQTAHKHTRWNELNKNLASLKRNMWKHFM